MCRQPVLCFFLVSSQQTCAIHGCSAQNYSLSIGAIATYYYAYNHSRWWLALNPSIMLTDLVAGSYERFLFGFHIDNLGDDKVLQDSNACETCAFGCTWSNNQLRTHHLRLAQAHHYNVPLATQHIRCNIVTVFCRCHDVPSPAHAYVPCIA